MTKAGRKCCKLFLKSLYGEEEAEAIASVAAATEIRVEAAVVAVLSELDGISELKKEQRMAFKCFLRGKEVFLLFSADFGKGCFTPQQTVAVQGAAVHI